jgi:hypothetical protein
MNRLRTASLRPIDLIHRLVICGLLFAIIVTAVAATLTSFKASRDCHGGFSAGFSSGFDRHRCVLKVQTVGDGPQIEIPLP